MQRQARQSDDPSNHKDLENVSLYSNETKILVTSQLKSNHYIFTFWSQRKGVVSN